MRFFAILILATGLFGQTPIFPLRQVQTGQHGIGKTVFSGNKIEEFQVEILGVLENLGPRQSIILARLSGGPLEKTGVMQGMSGSPVYIDGRLVGAVALAFNFSKEAIAGIRPIEEMLTVGDQRVNPVQTLAKAFRKAAREPLPAGAESLSTNLIEIATPVSFSGFTAGTLDHFAPELKKLGLEPRQGLSSGGNLPTNLGNPAQLRPGDMISVQLLSGDLSIGAEGTVTDVDGQRVYAFGHQFMSVGDTELPFARAEVLTLLPNLAASFKISSAKQWMGTITQDRSTAIYGELGRKAETVPLAITIKDGRPDAALVPHADGARSSPLAICRPDGHLFGYRSDGAHSGAGQLLASGRGGFPARRASAETRQHLRGRFQRARPGVLRRLYSPGFPDECRFRPSENQGH